MCFFPSFDPSCYLSWFAVATVVSRSPYKSWGSPRGFVEEGNIGKISKRTKEQQPIFREQGNKNLQIRERKHCKQIRGTNEGNVREHGNKGQFWKGDKGTRTPLGDLQSCCSCGTHVISRLYRQNCRKTDQVLIFCGVACEPKIVDFLPV